jgi:flagellar hook-length control protein FliK
LSTSTEGAVLKQPLGRTVTESQILDQVIGRMAVDRNHEASRMSIKLQPEELGRIEIDLTVEQGRIKAQIVAQSQQVQEVLERHLPRLREALEQQGLKLDQLQVSVDAQAGDGRGFSQQHRQAEDHGRPWFGSQPAALAAEREEVPPPAVSPLGKVSLRI